jgi:hypothetical protein
MGRPQRPVVQSRAPDLSTGQPSTIPHKLTVILENDCHPEQSEGPASAFAFAFASAFAFAFALDVAFAFAVVLPVSSRPADKHSDFHLEK